MFIPEIIRKKRDKLALSKAEISEFVRGYTNGDIPDYQASALLMATYLNGMNTDETVWLTDAMLNSGTVVNLTDIPGIKVDKHSTGGVGDKTSLIIAPICAAAGVPVPMISGRGLGHTGGTLDKLESIPGFKVDLGLEAYKQLISEVGLCLIGQTEDIAPADKKLYALRDVTSTVENKSLISASIMSKKLAEGIDALVLDVKTGSGAFMKTESEAMELAEMMLSIGKNMGKKMVSLVTDMNQPLGSHVGNALEVVESVMILKGDNSPVREDLVKLSKKLAAYMIFFADKANTLDEALEKVQNTIDDGSALYKLKLIVSRQHGNEAAIDDLTLLPTASHCVQVTAEQEGTIQEMDALKIGKGSVLLGAGRESLSSEIDSAVGVVVHRKVGDYVEAGAPVMDVLYNDTERKDNAMPLFQEAVSISPRSINPPRLIKKVLEG